MNQKETNEVRVPTECNKGESSDSILLYAEDFKVFDFHGAQFRAVSENGEPLFVANDVCEVLGYVNPRDVLSRFCKGVVKRDTLTSGGRQEINFIPESDLYRLIFRSKKPEAEAFADFVYETVLPSIRKTGAYSANQSELMQNVYCLSDAIQNLERTALRCGATVKPIVCQLPGGFALVKQITAPAKPQDVVFPHHVADVLKYIECCDQDTIPYQQVMEALSLRGNSLSVALNGRSDRKNKAGLFGICPAVTSEYLYDSLKHARSKVLKIDRPAFSAWMQEAKI